MGLGYGGESGCAGAWVRGPCLQTFTLPLAFMPWPHVHSYYGTQHLPALNLHACRVQGMRVECRRVLSLQVVDAGSR